MTSDAGSSQPVSRLQPGQAAAIWGVVAAVLAVLGRTRMRQVNPKPERTVQTLQQVPDALKGR